MQTPVQNDQVKNIQVNQILDFLKEVDSTFPVALSQKQDLIAFAEKLLNKATICFECENDKIVALVAGYTRNVIDNIAYISIVATLPEYYGQGKATKLVKQFIGISRQNNLNAVHLYTVESNQSAVKMYKRIGFEKYIIDEEQRPEDLHLIYYIR